MDAPGVGEQMKHDGDCRPTKGRTNPDCVLCMCEASYLVGEDLDDAFWICTRCAHFIIEGYLGGAGYV